MGSEIYWFGLDILCHMTQRGTLDKRYIGKCYLPSGYWAQDRKRKLLRDMLVDLSTGR